MHKLEIEIVQTDEGRSEHNLEKDMGWGKKNFGRNEKRQNTLKQVTLPIVDNDQCQNNLRKTRLGLSFDLHESFLCAGGKKGADACTGDGGGPLVCPHKKDFNRYANFL